MSQTSESTTVAWREILNKTHSTALILVCLGVWLHAADGLIVATMLPAIIDDIGGEAYVAWSVALYELGSIVAGAIGALTVLRWGVRVPMIAAATMFALGCLISALAPTMPILLSGRLFQGVGGGGLTALSFIAITVLFPARLSARVMAAVSVLWGASAFLGPIIGAGFVKYASWRWGFAFFGLQALFLAAYILFAARLTEAERSDAILSAPILRLILLASGVLLIAYAGIDISMPRTPILITLGLGMLLVFLRIDAGQSGNRILPKTPFNFRTPIGAALLMHLGMSIATMGLSTYGPLLLVIIHDTPTIVAGYVLASIAIGWTCAAILLSGAPERHDTIYIAGGMVLVFFSVPAMIYAMPNGPIALIAAIAAIEGIGYGAAWTFVLRRARKLAEPEDVERLSGALPTVGRFGFALGASLTGILANAAGFSADGSAEEASHVARVLFTGVVPFAFLGLFGMVCFVAPRHASPRGLSPTP